MASSSSALFIYLEADLVQTHGGCRPSGATDVDVILRALELATAEWTEREAGAELLRVFTRGELVAGQARLFADLYRSPIVHPHGIRAARGLRLALKQSVEAPSPSGDD